MNRLSIPELFFYCCVNLLPELTLMIMTCRDFLRFHKITTGILSIGTLICYFICTVTYSYGIMPYMTANIILNSTYILFGILLTKGKPWQLLFTLFIILDYGSVCSITAAGLFHVINQPGDPFGWQTSVLTLIIAVVFWYLYYRLLIKQLRPLFARHDSEKIWRTLWLVPALFCLIHYFCIWTQKGHFADSILNVIFLVIINLGSAFVSCLVAYIVDARTQALQLELENQRLLMSRTQYENIMSRMEETRRAQHDFRQHLRLISSYLDSGDEISLRDYLSKYSQTLPPDLGKRYCENNVADTVIRYYADFSNEFNITFSSNAIIPNNIGISDPDLCVLIGNMLENALESCKKHPESHTSIKLGARLSTPQTLAIIVDNYPADEPLPAKDQASRVLPSKASQALPSTKHNGMGGGTASISSIAKRYDGIASFDWKNGVFTTSVVLVISDNFSQINL